MATNERRASRGMILFGALSLLSLVIGYLITRHAPLRAALWDEKAAAWSQAVFGLLAIAGAFGAVQLQLANQRRGDIEKARQVRAHQLHAVFVTLSILLADIRSVAAAKDNGWSRQAKYVVGSALNEVYRIDPFALTSHTLLFQICSVKMGLLHLNADITDGYADNLLGLADCRARAGTIADHIETAAVFCESLLLRVMTPEEWQAVRAEQQELTEIRQKLGIPTVQPRK